jgi:putative membrane protein
VTFLANLVRGFLIGTAEVIPGVSGGTIALIVGIYERIIASAAALAGAIGDLLRLRIKSIPSRLKGVDFRLLVPVLVGMFAAIFAGAAMLEPLLESQPEIMRGLFFGMILVSLIVPYRMAASHWNLSDYLLGGVAAAISFGLLSLPGSEVTQPSYLIVFLAAAVAVCALVLPGVSGSFLLLVMGFYAPTIAAVNDRDPVYLGIFVLGAVFGLAIFAKGLNYLLTSRRRATLVVMTGLMLGSLRAIWPWQLEGGGLESPTSAGPALAIVAGVAVVGLIMVLEIRFSKAQ